jgi:hypothetical protein
MDTGKQPLTREDSQSTPAVCRVAKAMTRIGTSCQKATIYLPSGEAQKSGGIYRSR